MEVVNLEALKADLRKLAEKWKADLDTGDQWWMDADDCADELVSLLTEYGL